MALSNAGDIVLTSSSQRRGDICYIVLRLLKAYLKTKYRDKNGFNSCDKGLTREMVTTAAAVTSTMQKVEYFVKYNTTTDQTPLKQTTIVVGGKVTPRRYGARQCGSKTLKM
jgi:hypothetical protein